MHLSPGTPLEIGVILFVLMGFFWVGMYSKATAARLTAQFVLVILLCAAGFYGLSSFSRYYSPRRTFTGAVVHKNIHRWSRGGLTSDVEVRSASGEVLRFNSNDFLVQLLNQSQIVNVAYETWTRRAVSIEVISGDRAGAVLTPLVDARVPVREIVGLVIVSGLIVYVLFVIRKPSPVR